MEISTAPPPVMELAAVVGRLSSKSVDSSRAKRVLMVLDVQPRAHPMPNAMGPRVLGVANPPDSVSRVSSRAKRARAQANAGVAFVWMGSAAVPLVRAAATPATRPIPEG